MLNGKICHNKLSPEERCPLIRGSPEEMYYCNSKLIEQPYRYYFYKKGHSRITSTKLNDDVRSRYLHFVKQSQ